MPNKFNGIISPQVRKLIILLSNGKTVPEAAKELGLNRRTIEDKILLLRKALKCDTVTGLVAYFLRNKLIK